MKKKEILIPVFVTIVVFLIVAIPTYCVIQEDSREMTYEGGIPFDIEVDRYCDPYQPPNCGGFTVTPHHLNAFADKEFKFADDYSMGKEEGET